MVLHQGRIDGAMVDDQIDHHLQTQALRLNYRSPNLFPGGYRSLGIDEAGMEVEVVGDGIEAAGSAGLLDGIDEDPIEAHGCRPLQMGLPSAEGTGEQGKQVVDSHRRKEKGFWKPRTPGLVEAAGQRIPIFR